MVGRAAAVAMILCIALAGCSDGGGPAQTDDADCLTLRLVVVSSAIVPLAGVEVRLEPGSAVATSDAHGTVAFDCLAPGAYTLQAHRSGFLDAVTDVNMPQSGVVRMVLEPDRLLGSFFEATVFDGFLDVSFIVVAVSFTGGDASTNITFGARLPDLVQAELVWDATQVLGTDMEIVAVPLTGETVVPVINNSAGRSPVVLKLERALLEEYKVGPDVPLGLTIFSAGQDVGGTGQRVGVHLQQTFRLVTHTFYGFTPLEAWQFSIDGEPVPPA